MERVSPGELYRSFSRTHLGSDVWDVGRLTRLFRSFKILRMLRHESIVTLHEAFRRKGRLYLVFEFMETDLHAVIRAGILQDLHKKYIMYQCFKALMCAHTPRHAFARRPAPKNFAVFLNCWEKKID